MAEIEIQTGLRENTVGLVERFAEVASVDPLAAAMLLVGTIIVAVSIGAFGILTLGAILASIRRGLSNPGARPR